MRRTRIIGQVYLLYILPLPSYVYITYKTQLLHLHLLLEFGLPVDRETPELPGSLLTRAIQYRRIDLVRLLVKYNVNLNAGYGAHTRVAVRLGAYEILDYLISVGADVNLHFPGTLSLVLLAIMDENLPVLSRLISAGAIPPENWESFVHSHTMNRPRKIQDIKSILFPGAQ